MTENVYFIGTGFDAAVKIGVSRDIAHRLARIQLLSPDELRVLYLADTPAPYQLEAYLHEVFADFRLRGEWFRIPDLDTALIDKVVDAFIVPDRKPQSPDEYTEAAMVALRALIEQYRNTRALNVAQAAAAISADFGLSPQLLWKLQYRPFTAIPAADYAAVWAAASSLFPSLSAADFIPSARALISEARKRDRLPNEPEDQSTPRIEE